MKTFFSKALLLLLTLGLSFTVFAHDPSEHMKENVKPNCKAMDKMEKKEGAENDPVMQAMMQQCANQEATQSQHNHDHDTGRMKLDHSEHQHAH